MNVLLMGVVDMKGRLHVSYRNQRLPDDDEKRRSVSVGRIRVVFEIEKQRKPQALRVRPKCLLSGLCRCDGCAAGELKALARPTSVYATIRYSQKLMEGNGELLWRQGQDYLSIVEVSF